MAMYEEISLIIFKYLNSELSEEEKDKLVDWLKEPENRELFDFLCAENIAENHYEDYLTVKHRKRDTEKKIYAGINRKKRIIPAILKYAAIIMLPILVGVLVITNKKTGCVENKVLSAVTIKPGQAKARLTLSSGVRLYLKSGSKEEIKKIQGVNIDLNKGEISYSKEKNTKESKQDYNTLSIPRGGEYKLILSDGTKVWLNSSSSIKYPQIFTKKTRIVFLTGEAFFEVAKDKTKPFIVSVNGMKVEVLGTSFNVDAYEQEKISTTLVEGSVKVEVSGKKILIKPGEQLEYNRTSKKVNKIKVDTDFITGWKNGRLVFDNTRLEDILTKISRWYDVNIFYYNSSVKDLRFTFNIEKYADIDDVLRLIAETGKINYKISGNNVIIQ